MSPALKGAKPRIWSTNHRSCGGFAPAVLLCKHLRSAGESRYEPFYTTPNTKALEILAFPIISKRCQ